MPQWAGSCWYYLRYMDPHNTSAPFSQGWACWGPWTSIGGVEHAVLHLSPVLAQGSLRLRTGAHQGTLPEALRSGHDSCVFLPGRERQVLPPRGRQWVTREGGVPVATQMEKMSKSRLNVVNPNDVVDEYGCDACRVYEMLMGPLEQVKPWQMSGVEGVYRFLARVWRLFVDEETGALNPKIKPDTVDWGPIAPRHRHQERHRTWVLEFNTPVAPH